MSAASCACSPNLPLDEIARLETLDGGEINEAKKVLATEATALCHGRDAADDAAETARRVFAEGGIGDGPAGDRERPRPNSPRAIRRSSISTRPVWRRASARRGGSSAAAAPASTTKWSMTRNGASRSRT